jgi:hypothetical protein
VADDESVPPTGEDGTDQNGTDEQADPPLAGDRRQPIEPGSERLDAVVIAQSVPRSLLAAELFTAEPGADGLRDLFNAIGGFESLELATAEGAFDLVRFNPADSDQLLASHRLSYGVAENQERNEIWKLTSGVVEQAIWAPSVSHDFVHFNIDGTATMWVHGGGPGFAPRSAVMLGDDFAPLTRTEPLYASRFTSATGTVFALTGNGNYYANDRRYVSLIADDGDSVTTIDDGSRYAWVDNPTSDLVVAFPNPGEGFTAVWDAASLQPLPAHPLAGRPYQRIAVSADGEVAVGATFDGQLEIIDMSTGLATNRFGTVDIVGVDQPIALNRDGTVAVTVESSGTVTMWWVGEDTPIATIVADEAQPRWVPAAFAPTSASAVAPDTSRVALRTAARPGIQTSWIIVDTSVDAWVRRACEQAGRALTNREIDALGLPPGTRACDG